MAFAKELSNMLDIISNFFLHFIWGEFVFDLRVLGGKKHVRYWLKAIASNSSHIFAQAKCSHCAMALDYSF